MDDDDPTAAGPSPVGTPFSPAFLNRYRPVGFLGQGAMGSVYLMQ